MFYALCRGATAEERSALRLPPPEALASFAYLGGSGCVDVPGRDDGAVLAALRGAMAAVGVDEGTQAGFVLPALAAVLHLGNVGFCPLSEDASAVDPASAPALLAAAELLGVAPPALEAALTSRRLAAGGETVVAALSAAAAAHNRDALAKGIYASLFGWLVERVRQGLEAGCAVRVYDGPGRRSVATAGVLPAAPGAGAAAACGRFSAALVCPCCR